MLEKILDLKNYYIDYFHCETSTDIAEKINSNLQKYNKPDVL